MPRTTPQKSSDKPARAAGGNRQRIIECAIELFNHHGIQSVTIEQICVELTISPGNLTYHFKRKDDLIRATLNVLKDQMLFALRKPETVSTAQEGAQYLVRVFQSFWETRFFFNGLVFLAADNESMRKDYEALRDWVINTMEADINYLASKGLFVAPQPPNNFRLLSENIWMMLINWLHRQQMISPTSRTAPDDGLFDMALHLWSMCQLWLEPKFSKDLLTAFESLLLVPAPRKRVTTVARAAAKRAQSEAVDPLAVHDLSRR